MINQGLLFHLQISQMHERAISVKQLWRSYLHEVTRNTERNTERRGSEKASFKTSATVKTVSVQIRIREFKGATTFCESNLKLCCQACREVLAIKACIYN